MAYLGYIFLSSLIWILHLLPDLLFYQISNLFFVITYYLVGYRRKVVMENLQKAFPDLDRRERRKIARKYYQHMCDLILESAACHFYPETRARRVMEYLNPEVLDDLYKKGKMIMAVTGHYGNWEYLNTLSLATSYPYLAIYKPLKNKYFDRMTRQTREKWGCIPVDMEKVARHVMTYAKRKEPVLTLFLADQRPLFRQIQYWTDFMGQTTPLYLGTEKLARKLDAAVVFLKIRKPRRGHYTTEVEVITEHPRTLEAYELTRAHVRILEGMIRERPELWLWSHRRWKHSYERYERERLGKTALSDPGAGSTPS